MVDRESGHVLCDDCGEVLTRKAYRVDMQGCFCKSCLGDRATEAADETGSCDVSRVDTDLWMD